MLFRSGLSTIDESERIVVCVPCRNIETWELWLCTAADDLNERDDHKKRWQATAARTKDAVEAWFMTQSEPRATLEKAILPALADARTQIRRLKESVNR